MAKRRTADVVRSLILGDVSSGFFESAADFLYEVNYRTVRSGYAVSLIITLIALAFVPFVPRLEPGLNLTIGLAVFYVVGLVLLLSVVPRCHELLRFFYLMLVIVPLLVLIIAGATTHSWIYTTLFFMVIMAVPFLYIERPAYTLVLCLSLLAILMVFMVLMPDGLPVPLGVGLFESVICLCILCTMTASMRNLVLRNLEAEYAYRAEAARDPLTGLLNHASSEHQAHYYLGEPLRDVSCAFLVIDIDDFKAVNDTMGHRQGDQVLQAMAGLLKELFRQRDIIGRFGGDEFTVLMKDIDDLGVIRDKADQLNESLSGLLADQMVSRVSCSIGIAVDFHQKLSYQELFVAADRALYRAKQSGKGRYAVATEPIVMEERPLLLVVDDAEVSRIILTSCLGDGYETIEAVNGQQALELLVRYGARVRGVLLDVEMPVMDGRETLRRMAADEALRDIPVMVITAHGRDEAELRALGAVDFVEKPFDPQAVRESVSRMVKAPSTPADLC